MDLGTGNLTVLGWTSPFALDRSTSQDEFRKAIWGGVISLALAGIGGRRTPAASIGIVMLIGPGTRQEG